MPKNYWTPARRKYSRLMGLYARLPSLARDYVEAMLWEYHGSAIPSATAFTTIDLWQRWCSDNYSFIRKYRFWKTLKTEKHLDKEVPLLEKCDVTFFSYVLGEIAPAIDHHPGFNIIRDFRNELAHSSDFEVVDDLSFHEHFRRVEEAIDQLFARDLQRRQRWRKIVQHIRDDGNRCVIL